MLTVSQEIVISNFAKELINRLSEAIRNKPLARTSVRYVNGERVTNNFSATANTTGKSIRSLSYEITNEALIIKGEESIFTLIHGRKPTRESGTGSVRDAIRDWVRAKGIVSDDISEESLVFLIARKIHREGSSIYIRNNGGNSGLLTSVLNEQVLNDFNSKFTAQLIKEFEQELGD